MRGKFQTGKVPHIQISFYVIKGLASVFGLERELDHDVYASLAFDSLFSIRFMHQKNRLIFTVTKLLKNNETRDRNCKFVILLLFMILYRVYTKIRKYSFIIFEDRVLSFVVPVLI